MEFHDEEMLLASARPIRIIVEDEDGVPDNFVLVQVNSIKFHQDLKTQIMEFFHII